jgi:hypothetical protein
MEHIKAIFEKHPYLIGGACALVALYFLWPSSSSNSSAAQNTDPYGQQLAAETALSQSQLAEQAQVALGSQQEQTALDAATATSNEAIAQSNAAAIVAYNQTAQTSITAEGNLAIAQTATGSNDFSALINGLTAFGAQSASGASTASANGLDAYLTTIGAQFSDNVGGNSFEAQDNYLGANGVATLGLSGTSNDYGWNVDTGSGTNINFGSGGGALAALYDTTFNSNSDTFNQSSSYGGGAAVSNAADASLKNDVSALASPFATSDNLLGSLWGQAISAYSTNQASNIKTMPVLTPVTQPILTGNVQSLG